MFSNITSLVRKIWRRTIICFAFLICDQIICCSMLKKTNFSSLSGLDDNYLDGGHKTESWWKEMKTENTKQNWRTGSNPDSGK